MPKFALVGVQPSHYVGQGCPTFLTGGPSVQISNQTTEAP